MLRQKYILIKFHCFTYKISDRLLTTRYLTRISLTIAHSRTNRVHDLLCFGLVPKSYGGTNLLKEVRNKSVTFLRCCLLHDEGRVLELFWRLNILVNLFNFNQYMVCLYTTYKHLTTGQDVLRYRKIRLLATWT